MVGVREKVCGGKTSELSALESVDTKKNTIHFIRDEYWYSRVVNAVLLSAETSTCEGKFLVNAATYPYSMAQANALLLACKSVPCLGTMFTYSGMVES